MASLELIVAQFQGAKGRLQIGFAREGWGGGEEGAHIIFNILKDAGF